MEHSSVEPIVQCLSQGMQLCLNHGRQLRKNDRRLDVWVLTIIAPRSNGYTSFGKTYDDDWDVYGVAVFE